MNPRKWKEVDAAYIRICLRSAARRRNTFTCWPATRTFLLRTYTTTYAIRNRKPRCRAGSSERLELSVIGCPQISPWRTRQELTYTDIFLRLFIPTERSSLFSRKSNPSTSQLRPSSGMEANNCKHASKRTSPRMLPRDRLAQPVPRVATKKEQPKHHCPSRMESP